MTNRSEDYSEKITKLSQQLLQSITTWAQQTKAKPYLVGG